VFKNPDRKGLKSYPTMSGTRDHFFLKRNQNYATSQNIRCQIPEDVV